MNNILYEASLQLDLFFLIPLFMLIFTAAFPKIWKKSWEGKETRVSYKTVKVFCACCFIFVLIHSLIVGLSQIHMYQETVVAYKNGDYEIVEGYVENFDPMPYEGRSDESFEINGISFSYSDYVVQFGYHNAKSHGGVIKGNGQQLRIGYVDYNGENVIVYIEQL